MIPAFKMLKFADDVLQRFQANIAEVFAALAPIGILNGKLVAYTAGNSIPAQNDLVVNHNLGRVPLGILPLVAPSSSFVTPAAGGGFVQSATRNATPTTSAILFCTNAIRAGAVFAFWVF